MSMSAVPPDIGRTVPSEDFSAANASLSVRGSASSNGLRGFLLSFRF
jgi:hypothetical protein